MWQKQLTNIEVAGSQSGFPKKPFSPLMSNRFSVSSMNMLKTIYQRCTHTHTQECPLLFITAGPTIQGFTGAPARKISQTESSMGWWGRMWAFASVLMFASVTQPFQLPGFRISSSVSLRHTLSPLLPNPSAVTPFGRCVRMCAAPQGEGKADRSTPASTSRAEGAARLCYCGVLGNTGLLTIDCWQFWQPPVGNRCRQS